MTSEAPPRLLPRRRHLRHLPTVGDVGVTSSVADEEVLLNSTHHILNLDDLTDLGKIITTEHNN